MDRSCQLQTFQSKKILPHVKEHNALDSTFQIYITTVSKYGAICLIMWLVIWSASLSCLIEMEKFQRSCLTGVFGQKAHADIISANGIFPVIQLSMFSVFASLCLGINDFNIQDDVRFTMKPENEIQNMPNPFAVNPSLPDSSFFHRAVNACIYFYRQNILE